MTIRTSLKLIFLGALSVALASCAAGLLSSSYRDSLSKWTRQDAIYSGIDTRLIVHATYKGAEFREAYLSQYSDIYGASKEAIALKRRDDLADEASFTEIVVVVFTPDPLLDDFGSRSSIWMVNIEAPGGPIYPYSVTKAADSALLRQMYPHIDQWSTAYVLRFPKHTEASTEPFPGPDTKELRLVVTGVPGRAELVWKLKD